MQLKRIPKPVRRLLSGAAHGFMDLRDLRRSEPRKIIWILGHMRSGSTLLMHLLGSHPEILGAGERNMTYEAPSDLRKLEVVSFLARRRLFRDYDFVLDQINHGRFVPNPELLDEARLYKIFLVRRPEASLASMIQVFGKIYGQSADDAVDYYRGRLAELQAAACHGSDRRRHLLVCYEDLLENTEVTLKRLEHFLELESPLRETYEIFDFTGKRGDPSKRIQSGRIRRDLPPRQADLDPEVLSSLQDLHRECLETLSARCFEPPVETPPEA